MVVDTSAILAVLFNEPKGPEIARIMSLQRRSLKMSTVNLAEALILIEERQPKMFTLLRDELVQSSIKFVPPSIEQSQIAAAARSRLPLNLGDCFAYALAKSTNEKLLTLDKDFQRTDLDLCCPK